MAEFISTWVSATMDLRTKETGGLRRTWDAPTPSFLYLFGSAQVGADLYTEDGNPLDPGDVGRSVVLRFWSPAARDIIRPGSYFVVVYGDRVIGGGVIDELLEERPAVARRR